MRTGSVVPGCKCHQTLLTDCKRFMACTLREAPSLTYCVRRVFYTCTARFTNVAPSLTLIDRFMACTLREAPSPTYCVRGVFYTGSAHFINLAASLTLVLRFMACTLREAPSPTYSVRGVFYTRTARFTNITPSLTFRSVHGMHSARSPESDLLRPRCLLHTHSTLRQHNPESDVNRLFLSAHHGQ